MTDKPKLEAGRMYEVEITVGPTRYNFQGRKLIPSQRFIVTMKLLEKRGNGVCMMERDAWIIQDPPYTGHNRFIKGHEIVKVKRSQIRAAA